MNFSSPIIELHEFDVQDYEGQKLAEALLQYIIIMFASVGFVWGYLCQQFEQTVYVTLAGVTLAFIVSRCILDVQCHFSLAKISNTY